MHKNQQQLDNENNTKEPSPCVVGCGLNYRRATVDGQDLAGDEVGTA